MRSVSLKALASLSLLTVGFLLCQASDIARSQTVDPKGFRQALLLATIADRHVSEEKLMQAVTQLTVPPTELPQYWSRLANDVRYPRFQRREAAYQLFKRHVRTGMRLSELNSLLQHPTWLHASDMSVIEELGGKIPVHWNFADTVLVIRILDVAAVYLVVAGKVELQRFQDLFLNPPDPSVGYAKIVEIGFSPPRFR